ncbi:FAD-dependent oxidoreductase [Dactylosporangium vinaceum]|uniref:FAD-dependent oxidoreductase n=1 Tax=Dactylosporangium vinaceum TaxID=53362 RepID=A0ABV5LYM9_9ACTN|nr:FAD-dependent oxidoreductase [Dactylosporangium vinaceum]UAB95300.1 FAD-dependent oxidoreductase [Dactylosporangium vinaceum]
MRRSVAVIGAGAGGAAAAYCLAKAGLEVDVYEASGGVGGLARSVGLWGQSVGVGPQHFFSADPRVNELWLEVVGGDFEMVEPVVGSHPARAAAAGSGLGGLLRGVWPRHGRRAAVPEFAHPRHGFGEVYSRMCEFVEKRGGRVHLDTPVAQLVVDDDRVVGVRLNNADVYEHDHVVSSMPPAVLAGRLPAVPAAVAAAGAGLTLGNTVVVYLLTSGQSVFRDTWINVRDPSLRTGRITNFDNWVPAAKRGEPETVVALEYWCSGEHEFWRWEDEQYVALARNELAATGLVDIDEILDGVALRVPKSLPVYRESLRRHLDVLEDHLQGLSGLEVIGQHGPIVRNRQGHGILMGMLAAQNIVEDAGHDLWADPAVHAHPATSRITATGLVY